MPPDAPPHILEDLADAGIGAKTDLCTVALVGTYLAYLTKLGHFPGAGVDLLGRDLPGQVAAHNPRSRMLLILSRRFSAAMAPAAWSDVGQSGSAGLRIATNALTGPIWLTMAAAPAPIRAVVARKFWCLAFYFSVWAQQRKKMKILLQV